MYRKNMKGLSVEARLVPFLTMISLLFFVQVGIKAASTSIQTQLISISQDNSRLRFSAEHAGMPFEGKFELWNATLRLPPLENPNISASFELSSAKTGDRTYDTALSEGDWFDIENHPQGSFNATSISVLADNGGYFVDGELTLRGITKPIQFELIRASSGFKADINIDRLAFNIGLDSDPDAEWVSRYIKLSLTIA